MSKLPREHIWVSTPRERRRCDGFHCALGSSENGILSYSFGISTALVIQILHMCYHFNWRSLNIWPHVVPKLTSLNFCIYYEEVEVGLWSAWLLRRNACREGLSSVFYLLFAVIGYWFITFESTKVILNYTIILIFSTNLHQLFLPRQPHMQPRQD